jgi:hypothetical protein
MAWKSAIIEEIAQCQQFVLSSATSKRSKRIRGVARTQSRGGPKPAPGTGLIIESRHLYVNGMQDFLWDVTRIQERGLGCTGGAGGSYGLGTSQQALTQDG